MPIRAVVLAAGHGKRMKSGKAKVLHDVLGKPILGRILDVIDELKLEAVHLVIGHQADQLRQYLGARQNNPANANGATPTPLHTHVQEPLLGTGHALQIVASELGNFKGTLLVTVGDAPLLTRQTLRQFVDEHLESKAMVSLLTTVVPDAKMYGRIVRDGNGHVTSIVEDKDCTAEQKKIQEINPAIYCFQWPDIQPGLTALKNDNRQKEYYLTDLIGWSTGINRPVGATTASDWREVAGINSQAELAEAASHLRDRTAASLSADKGVAILDPVSTWIAPEVKVASGTSILPGCYLIGDIEIGADCTVGPHTLMQGKVQVGDRTNVIQSHIANSQIGSDCRIGPFSHMRDGTVVGNNCRIGNFVELKKSNIGDRTNVSHLSYVGDATLGQHVNIGAGTITANYNHLTGAKSQTVIKDGAFTGSNSVLVAPITLGESSSVAAGTVATRDVPPGDLAVGRARQENKAGWVTKNKPAK